MDGKGEGLSWFCQMGLQVCLELMHVMLKRTSLYEQGSVHGVFVLMEVG